MSQSGLIDREFVTTTMTADDRWCFTHGATEGSPELGAGILYYAMTYSLKAMVCVCLGSGGGYVPRLMRQAQRDLELENSKTYIVDGAPFVAAENKFWGEPCWLDENSTFRTNYPEVEVVVKLTADACKEYFVPNQIRIDYLHIDADHSYEGVKLDWDLFSPLVPDEGIISLHDTTNFRSPCGVPQLVKEIQESGNYAVINFPIKYGTAIVKKLGR